MANISDNIKTHLSSLAQTENINWSKLEEIVETRQYKKGEHFFQHFEQSDEVAIVHKGLFRIYLTNTDGEEKTYSFIPEYSFILDFFLSWKKHTMVSVQALEDSELYVLKYQSFLNLMKSEHIWHDIYREILLRNYMFKTKREIEFVQFNAKERLTKFAQNKRIDINRIPKTYLASYLGIQPPSLSRLLREIKDEASN